MHEFQDKKRPNWGRVNYGIVNYYAVVFLLHPPYFLRCEPRLDRKNVRNSQESGVRTRRAAILNHYAIVNLLRRENLPRRSNFSTAGSFGEGMGVTGMHANVAVLGTPFSQPQTEKKKKSPKRQPS